MDAEKRQSVLKAVASVLGKEEDAVFAYVHGSFLGGGEFQDIDIGVYLAGPLPEFILGKEVDMERRLEDRLGIPADVRVINGAPASFVYHMLNGGAVVLDRDLDLRADFECLVRKKYSDFLHLRNEYLREIRNAPV